jgi:hypothetical protein
MDITRYRKAIPQAVKTRTVGADSEIVSLDLDIALEY